MVRQRATGDNLSPPPDGKQQSRSRWAWEEAKYHLFPWGPSFFVQKPAIIAGGIGFAVVVTVAWLLAATGRVAPAVVIAWWTGWSVYEFVCRMRCKPFIKEGPWWGREYRRAGVMDMIAYVATKNLLIGAALFAVLYFLGVLPEPLN